MPIIMDNIAIETLMMDGTEILTATMDGITVYNKVNLTSYVEYGQWRNRTANHSEYEISMNPLPSGVPSNWDSDSRFAITFTIAYTNPTGSQQLVNARVEDDHIFVPTGQEEVNIYIGGSNSGGLVLFFDYSSSGIPWSLLYITSITINNIAFFG